MKYLHTNSFLPTYYALICFAVGALSSSWAQAQELSREETKALLIEIKQLKKDLPRFQAMKIENGQLSSKIISQEQTLSQKQAEQAKYSDKLLKEKDEAIEYEESLLKDLLANKKNTRCAFAVQIGAYQSRDLSQYSSQYPKFIVEPGDDGLKKYSIGIFESYHEARAFSRFLNSVGAQTYVVGFYSGSRVPDLRDMTECTF